MQKKGAICNVKSQMTSGHVKRWLLLQSSFSWVAGTGNWGTDGRFTSRKHQPWQAWEVNGKSTRTLGPIPGVPCRPQSAEHTLVIVLKSWHLVTRLSSDLCRVWTAPELTIILKKTKETMKTWGDICYLSLPSFLQGSPPTFALWFWRKSLGLSGTQLPHLLTEV